jgi:hypothetical protein
MMVGERQYFFLSDFYKYGGCVTFTAHLLHSLGKKRLVNITNGSGERIKDFGYGINYHNVSVDVLDTIKNPFITDMFKNFHLLEKLKRNDITIVIHDPTEISKENVPYLKYWNIICIRKTFREYLKSRYNLDPKFLYHPFYPYPIQNYDGYDDNDNNNSLEKIETVSISRIDYGKNTEIIMEANKLITSKNNNNNKPIKIYGPFNPKYVYHKLGKEHFEQYYYGTFKKSFAAVSKILSKAKFMVDLSLLLHDGGGTQYTFLEAIHNNTALIINRKWIEDVDPKFRDFKEGYNCYAVSNGHELAEIINNSKKIDTNKIIHNAKKLIERHTTVDWSIM